MLMEIVPTHFEDRHIPTSFPVYEQCFEVFKRSTTIPGLTCRYELPMNQKHMEDIDCPWYNFKTDPVVWSNREFSVDDQLVLKEHLEMLLATKEKMVIVEIGVHRNAYGDSSTGIILQGKRDHDIYVGIDIENKNFLDNTEKNIHTIQTSSTNIPAIQELFQSLGITQIDLFMVDGWHSINQVYAEWELYTPLLSPGGKVIFHDTNAHPGPYFVTKSIDTTQYRVQKYLNDIQDWGISVATKR